jgi:16S rRNA processing protein RimM
MGQSSNSGKLIVIGSIGAPFGVRGWVKVNSYTEPRENIINFLNWRLITDSVQEISVAIKKVKELKRHQDNYIALLDGVSDRNQAALFTNRKIAVFREELPSLTEGEYYWADLVGATVINVNQVDASQTVLGIVVELFETGANDILLVKDSHTAKEYLIPYIQNQTILKVNLTEPKSILVDWEDIDAV